jgi:hypothetical protein
MGVRLTTAENVVAIFDSVSGFAFGPVFESDEAAEAFITFLPMDARTYSVGDLELMYGRWVESRQKAGL